MAKLRDRPTADLVIIFLAAVVGLSAMLGVVGLFWAASQGRDVSNLAIRVSGVINTLSGAVVGYVAGRGTANIQTADQTIEQVQRLVDSSVQQSHSRGD